MIIDRNISITTSTDGISNSYCHKNKAQETTGLAPWRNVPLLSIKVVVLAVNLVQFFFTFTDGLITLPSKSDMERFDDTDTSPTTQRCLICIRRGKCWCDTLSFLISFLSFTNNLTSCQWSGNLVALFQKPRGKPRGRLLILSYKLSSIFFSFLFNISSLP